MDLSSAIRFMPTRHLAELMGVYPSQVSRWMAGKSYRDSQLDSVCKRLGVPKGVVVQGLELRRQDRACRRDAEDLADSFLAVPSRYEDADCGS